jgi:hypothetical protein
MRRAGRIPRANADRKVSATGIIDRMRIARGAPANSNPVLTRPLTTGDHRMTPGTTGPISRAIDIHGPHPLAAMW